MNKYNCISQAVQARMELTRTTLSEVVESYAEKLKNRLKKQAAQKAAIRASNKVKGLKEKRYPSKKLVELGPDDRARARAKQKVRDERRKTLKNAVFIDPVVSNPHAAPHAVGSVLPQVVDLLPEMIVPTKPKVFVIESSDDDEMVEAFELPTGAPLPNRQRASSKQTSNGFRDVSSALSSVSRIAPH